MMSQINIFILLYLIIFPLLGICQVNIDRVIPKNVIGEIKKSEAIFNDKSLESIYFSTVIPKKIVTEELEMLYEELGNVEKEKKVYKATIQSKGELLSLLTVISKDKKRTSIFISDNKNLENKSSIENLQETFQKILKRKFLNDYILMLEKNIKKIDRRQNKIIRNNPNNLMMNSGFFYKIYQNNESKKVGLKSSLETLYEELENIKILYNSIK